MTLAVYDSPKGTFIGQAYTPEVLWRMGWIALKRTNEVWLHGRVNGKIVSRRFDRKTFYEEVIEQFLPRL